MRRLALVAVPLLALVFAAAASARDPRAEQERLRAGDMKAARSAVLTRGDLADGFQQDRAAANDTPLSCPGYKPDFSRFVMTGKAHANYTNPAGAWIMSAVEVYASRAHATGDFRTGAQPGVAACLARTLRQAGAGGQVKVTVLSSKMIAAPKLGDRAARYRATARFAGPAATVTVYLDMIAFQKGRALGAFAAMSVSQPISDSTDLARLMLRRM